MIEHVNESIERAARLTELSPEEVLKQGIVRSKIPLSSRASSNCSNSRPMVASSSSSSGVAMYSVIGNAFRERMGLQYDYRQLPSGSPLRGGQVEDGMMRRPEPRVTLRIYSPSVSVRAGVLSLAMTARGMGALTLLQ